MMDLYTVFVEVLFQSQYLTLFILAAAIFGYLAWCHVGIYTNLMIVGLFSLSFLWVTGNLLFTGLIILSMLYGAFAEFKKELAEA